MQILIILNQDENQQEIKIKKWKKLIKEKKKFEKSVTCLLKILKLE